MKEYLLFDLDGTLTDPKEGITTCVQYALKDQGIDEPDLDKLEPFIGPPLKDSFMEFYGMNEEQADRAITKYRERFETTGLYENKVYEGIAQMLRTLQSKKLHLAVASSKPTVFVEKILEHFQLRKYFQVVVGSELDGTRTKKEEVVEEALNQLFDYKPIQRDKVYMIGDRKFDVEGARALSVESVGVSYGYGSIEELKEAKADYIVRSVEELQKFLLRGVEEAENGKKKAVANKGFTFSKMWVLLYCLLLFVCVKGVVEYGLSYLMLTVGQNCTPGAAEGILFLWSAEGTLEGFPGNVGTVVSALGFVAGAFSIWSTAKVLLNKTAEEMRLTHLKPEPNKNYLLLGLTSIGTIFGMNMLFELMEVTNKSEAYQAAVADQFSANLLISIICYGFISPIAEELLFRGVFFTYLRHHVNLKFAMILSSFAFGAYHMNSIQGVYAFVMGCLMAYAYEYFGTFKAPLVIHISSNILAYCMSYTSMAVSGFVCWPVCIIFLAMAVFGIRALSRQKKLF